MINSPIDEIRSKLDIVDVIGGYLKLQKAGANYRAVCPFHVDKKPSLFVSPARQIWKCFGCGEGGGIFDFVMKIEGMDFGDALRVLAQRAGVELKKPTPEMMKYQTEKTRLYEICELAAQFFQKQLKESKAGKEVKEYLAERGVSDDSIEKWRIGYAPDTWQGLADFLSKKRYKTWEIEKAGLEIKNQKGNVYDRFRGRIIFPISDLNSQVIGFGGRVREDRKTEDSAKYVNTPNTLLYDKSRVLYGLDKGKVEARRKDFCILVEGYMDAIMVSQAGFENVAAVSGTALTNFQLDHLKRFSDNLYTAFDMDVAGGSATQRGIDLAQAKGFNIKVIMMPEGKDPADMAKEGMEEWEKIVKEARSITEFYFQSAFLKNDSSTAEGKMAISKMLLPIIKNIPNKIGQSHWIGELSSRLRVKEEDLREEMNKVKEEKTFLKVSPESASAAEKRKKTKKELLEERVLSLAYKFSSCLSAVSEEALSYFSPKCVQILSQFKSASPQSVSASSFSPEVRDFFNAICLAAEASYNPLQEDFEAEDAPEPEEEVNVCLNEIKRMGVKEKLSSISEEIREAEMKGETEKTEKLTADFRDLSQNLK
jgi:DNA primase